MHICQTRFSFGVAVRLDGDIPCTDTKHNCTVGTRVAQKQLPGIKQLCAVCPPEKRFSSVRTLEYILSIYSYKRVGREMHLNFAQNLVGGSIAAAVGKGRVGHDKHVHARWREPKNNVPGEHRTWHLANYLRSAEIIAYNQLS